MSLLPLIARLFRHFHGLFQGNERQVNVAGPYEILSSSYHLSTFLAPMPRWRLSGHHPSSGAMAVQSSCPLRSLLKTSQMGLALRQQRLTRSASQ